LGCTHSQSDLDGDGATSRHRQGGKPLVLRHNSWWER
jgi:hypothetical protein